jgi:hypothetical protein
VVRPLRITPIVASAALCASPPLAGSASVTCVKNCCDALSSSSNASWYASARASADEPSPSADASRLATRATLLEMQQTMHRRHAIRHGERLVAARRQMQHGGAPLERRCVRGALRHRVAQQRRLLGTGCRQHTLGNVDATRLQRHTNRVPVLLQRQRLLKHALNKRFETRIDHTATALTAIDRRTRVRHRRRCANECTRRCTSTQSFRRSDSATTRRIQIASTQCKRHRVAQCTDMIVNLERLFVKKKKKKKKNVKTKKKKKNKTRK